jgi:hypothetical protein
VFDTERGLGKVAVNELLPRSSRGIARANVKRVQPTLCRATGHPFLTGVAGVFGKVSGALRLER